MDSQTAYLKIQLLYSWLRNQGYGSIVKLPRSLSWINLSCATPSIIPVTPGFYIVRSAKPTREGSDIVYIGESNNLSRRIGYLRGAIRRGNAPHSGGRNLRERFGGDLSQFEICWLKTTNVYTAKMFERYLILTFYEEHGHLPIGNKE